MSYLLWKLVHVLSVVLFLGNISTGLFWAAQARRSRDPALVAITFGGIIRSDRWFTLPGVIGILVSGFAASAAGGYPVLGTGWILWSLVLFGISGIIFGAWVSPLQGRIRSLASAGEGGDMDWEAFRALYRRWELTGALALVTPLAAAALMVLKPALPAL